MNLRVCLTLGRVSNLPTVWTNALAGAVLSGQPTLGPIALSALALTLFYVGGMWLNDAFDAVIDARERTSRPIPNGQISRRTVFIVGFALLACGAGLSFLVGSVTGLVGLALTGVIVLYDWVHKRTVLSPIIMGAARFCSYLLAASAVGQVSGAVLAGAMGLWAFTAGLTYAAKHEAYDRLEKTWPLVVLAAPLLFALYAASKSVWALVLWGALIALVFIALRRLLRRAPGDVPKAVVTLIAGMSLYDAVLIAGNGYPVLGLVAAVGCALTLALQRLVSGT